MTFPNILASYATALCMTRSGILYFPMTRKPSDLFLCSRSSFWSCSRLIQGRATLQVFLSSGRCSRCRLALIHMANMRLLLCSEFPSITGSKEEKLRIVHMCGA